MVTTNKAQKKVEVVNIGKVSQDTMGYSRGKYTELIRTVHPNCPWDIFPKKQLK
jgi:hypothetical protein